MQLLDSAADGLRWWSASFRSRPVVLSAPHRPEECFRLLDAVTTRRAIIWLLDSKKFGRRGPRLRGKVDPSEVSVARFDEMSSRNSFAPWLDLRLEPSPDGGTLLFGRIGLREDVKLVFALTAAIWSLIIPAMFVGGIAQLVAGQLSGALPFILIPIVMAAGFVGLNIAGLRSLERDLPDLIHEVQEILGATST